MQSSTFVWRPGQNTNLNKIRAMRLSRFWVGWGLYTIRLALPTGSAFLVLWQTVPVQSVRQAIQHYLATQIEVLFFRIKDTEERDSQGGIHAGYG